MLETIGVSDMKGVAADVVCDRFSDEGWVRTKVHVAREMELTIYVNEKALVTILSFFKTQGRKVDSDLVATPGDVLSLMKQMEEQMELYQLSGGVHTSALSDTRNLLVVAEDIGRHNTLNKIQGECLLRGISPRDSLMLSTGRISSEMLLKAAKMQAPIVVSRHAPTRNAILLAGDLGIALVGRARGNQLAVYTHPERLGCSSNKCG
ncbi:MAG: formate dehydrogenase accessory sulfurtransferase FdhD [Desulfosporosinus sp.]